MLRKAYGDGVMNRPLGMSVLITSGRLVARRALSFLSLSARICGISKPIVHRILTGGPHVKKVCTRMVPKVLMRDKGASFVDVSGMS